LDRKDGSNYTMLKRQPYLSLTDIAYKTLVEAIINQDFKPGTAISIDSLAKNLSMSNTPVREALMRAHGERLVTQKTNHGFIVANLLTPDELNQLFEVRYLIEIHALKTGKISSDAVNAVTALVEKMVSSTDGKVYDDFHEYMALDHQFHYALVGLAGNQFLQAAWEDLHVHLHLSRLYTGIGLFDRSDSTTEHQAILEALQRGEQETAVELLKKHIKRVERRMESFLKT
jgi:DNA-binding GntR family transcriptional regulator